MIPESTISPEKPRRVRQSENVAEKTAAELYQNYPENDADVVNGGRLLNFQSGGRLTAV
jgi:hypothetical protein